MGSKGDGKKRRPKKGGTSSSGGGTPSGGAGASSSSSSSSSSSGAQHTASPRVTSNSLVPVRRQIEYGKLNKQLREGVVGASFRQVVRTKYRKQLDEEEMAVKAEERKRKGQDPDWSVILNRTAADPLVIVDGYNIIFKWPRLKKHMTKGDTDRARQLLLEDLEDLASLKRWRIECVFDGAGRGVSNGPGPLLGGNNGGVGSFSSSFATTVTGADKAPTKVVTKHGVRAVFTGRGVEADSYIEGRCAAAKNVTLGKTTDSLIVATDDALIRMAATNAGALCMGADRFVTELKAVKNSVAYRVEAAMAQVNGHQIRPEGLWGTNVFVPTTGGNGGGGAPKMERIEEKADGSIVYVRRYGHGQAIVEDRRNRHRNRKNGSTGKADSPVNENGNGTGGNITDGAAGQLHQQQHKSKSDDDVQTSS
jgi:predicted RNA-binding protein with PIN domain